MTEAARVTVFILSSDPNSACPLLYQILKGLCYSSMRCTVPPHKGGHQSVLGALELMVGILNIGLGLIVYTNIYSFYCNVVFPLLVGAVFISCGIMRILSEKYPRLWPVFMVLILAEFGFAIAGVILYAIDLKPSLLHWNSCPDFDNNLWSNSGSGNKCLEAKELTMMLLTSMTISLVLVSVLVLGIVILTFILCIDAVCNRERENKDTEDSELYKALLEDVPVNPIV